MVTPSGVAVRQQPRRAVLAALTCVLTSAGCAEPRSTALGTQAPEGHARPQRPEGHASARPSEGDAAAPAKSGVSAPRAPALPAPVATSNAESKAAVDAGAEAEPDAEIAPELLAPDGSPLPQTHARPRSDSPGLRLRLERLVDAIANDDPERALPAFFPLVAYEQVKAIADPARDWRERLMRAFRRDIHAYHREIGPGAAGARLASITCNERAVRWMDPGAEGNRLGYYRVTRSRLRLRLADGAVREFALTSLISWRGAWYIVHLNGFSQ